MARRIADAGLPLTLWARRPESLEPFTDTAASFAVTPAELGAASDIVGICVVADADVEDVVLRADGVLAGMAPGGVIAIHSTIHPDTCQRLADAAAERKVAVVDAPVSGGAPAAVAGTLLVMAGGDAGDVAKCRPMFETFASPVIHLGPLGSGQMAKLMNNFVFTAQLAVALDTYALADDLGVDRAALGQVLAHGSGGSPAAGIVAGMDFDITGSASLAGLLRKDVGITLAVARAAGAVAPEALVDLAERTLATLDAGLARSRAGSGAAEGAVRRRSPAAPARRRPRGRGARRTGWASTSSELPERAEVAVGRGGQGLLDQVVAGDVDGVHPVHRVGDGRAGRRVCVDQRASPARRPRVERGRVGEQRRGPAPRRRAPPTTAPGRTT